MRQTKNNQNTAPHANSQLSTSETHTMQHQKKTMCERVEHRKKNMSAHRERER